MVRPYRIFKQYWYRKYVFNQDYFVKLTRGLEEGLASYYRLHNKPFNRVRKFHLEMDFVALLKLLRSKEFFWFRYKKKRPSRRFVETYRVGYISPYKVLAFINRFPDFSGRCFFPYVYFNTFKRVARYFFIKQEKPFFFRYTHAYHIVNPSPWPFFVSIGLFVFIIGIVRYIHFYTNYENLIGVGFFLLMLAVCFWWRDVIREGTFEGFHTKIVQKGLRMGMLLFIVSEVMFFFAFFWSFFHSSLSPAIEIGGIWPPIGIIALDPWKMPLLNTMYLLASGAWVTWAHCEICAPIIFKGIKKSYLRRPFSLNIKKITFFNSNFLDKLFFHKENRIQYFFQHNSFLNNVVGGLFGTIAFGLLFTFTQWGEYDEASFFISDGIYGSVFYMATGFHGLHVLIGTCFLIICLLRYLRNHFTRQHHVGFEAAVWYWHFVDVVWLFLYLCVYHWGS